MRTTGRQFHRWPQRKEEPNAGGIRRIRPRQNPDLRSGMSSLTHGIFPQQPRRGTTNLGAAYRARVNGQRTREIPGRHRLREGFCLHLPSRNSLRCRWRDDGSPTACATQQSHDVHPGAARGHASACACPSPRQSAQSDSLRGRRSQFLTGLVAVRHFQFNPLVTLVVASVRMNGARIHLHPAVESTANQ